MRVRNAHSALLNKCKLLGNCQVWLSVCYRSHRHDRHKKEDRPVHFRAEGPAMSRHIWFASDLLSTDEIACRKELCNLSYTFEANKSFRSLTAGPAPRSCRPLARPIASLMRLCASHGHQA